MYSQRFLCKFGWNWQQLLMYTCTRMYACTHTCTLHTCTHTHTHTHKHTTQYLGVVLSACVCKNTAKCVYMYIIDAWKLRVSLAWCTKNWNLPSVYAHTHTHTHTHTHMHTHTCAVSTSCSLRRTLRCHNCMHSVCSTAPQYGGTYTKFNNSFHQEDSWHSLLNFLGLSSPLHIYPITCQYNLSW